MIEGKFAQKYFHDGQIFHKIHGAGVWNVVFTLSCRLGEAQSFEQIDKAEAIKVYQYIADLGIGNFSYMYHPAFDYYQTMAYVKLDQEEKGKTMLKKVMAIFSARRFSCHFSKIRRMHEANTIHIFPAWHMRLWMKNKQR